MNRVSFVVFRVRAVLGGVYPNGMLSGEREAEELLIYVLSLSLNMVNEVATIPNL